MIKNVSNLKTPMEEKFEKKWYNNISNNFINMFIIQLSNIFIIKPNIFCNSYDDLKNGLSINELSELIITKNDF